MSPIITPSPATLAQLQGKPQAVFQLYLAWACPFCHRVLLAIAFNGLEDWFNITWTRDIKPDNGWEIDAQHEPLWHADSVKALYQLASDGQQQGSAVPLLVEIHSKRLLSDASADIVRWLGSGFDGAVAVPHPLLANHSTEAMDNITQTLHERLNRAVYRVLSADGQADYETQVEQIFACLNEWETRLGQQTYALGETLSEADTFLLPTLLRFDAIYYRLFYCAKKRIADYPNLSRYLQQIQTLPKVADTFNLKRSMRHYYLSAIHLNGQPVRLNPLGVVPVIE